MTVSGTSSAWRRLPHPVRWMAVAIVGGTLIVVGLLMLVLPGPGIAVLALGLVVLATEFAWAERTLHKLRSGGSATMARARSVWRKPGSRSSE